MVVFAQTDRTSNKQREFPVREQESDQARLAGENWHGVHRTSSREKPCSVIA